MQYNHNMSFKKILHVNEYKMKEIAQSVGNGTRYVLFLDEIKNR